MITRVNSRRTSACQPVTKWDVIVEDIASKRTDKGGRTPDVSVHLAPKVINARQVRTHQITVCLSVCPSRHISWLLLYHSNDHSLSLSLFCIVVTSFEFNVMYSRALTEYSNTNRVFEYYVRIRITFSLFCVCTISVLHFLYYKPQ